MPPVPPLSAVAMRDGEAPGDEALAALCLWAHSVQEGIRQRPQRGLPVFVRRDGTPRSGRSDIGETCFGSTVMGTGVTSSSCWAV